MARITQGEIFAKIPHWLIDHPRSDPYVLAVYAVLSKRANNETRNTYPGMRRIAKESKTSLSSVQRVVKVLEEIGALEIKREKGMRNGKEWHLVNRYHLPPFPFGGVPSHNTPSEIGVSPGSTPRTVEEYTPVLPDSTELDPSELDERTRDHFALETPKEPRLPGESRAAYARRLSE